MADILVHLDGSVEETLKRLVEAGFFKTKAEAVRAGILELGKEYHVVKSREELMDELAVAKMQRMDEEIKSGKRRALTLRDVQKKYPEAFE
jgi:Arc/MetJ-type ribon-helix-helix transcriptional regulator